jgi:RNA 3'-terminal phosphate cyclase (ATP)
VSSTKSQLVSLDGSRGEGGGQVIRTALTLSLLTGRPFTVARIRANRGNPGLRPQHLKAVEAAALLGNAEVSGASVGSHQLTFRPCIYTPKDLSIEIGTAGSSALVLQTLHLPLALRAERPVHVTITGGTFNTKAPSFPFLETTWRAHLAAMGLPLVLSMPSSGFYPRGGGRLEAWIEPLAKSVGSLDAVARGPLSRIRGIAGVTRLPSTVADRMRTRAESRLARLGVRAEVTIDLAEWAGPNPGAAIVLWAEHEGLATPASFVGLGERGKPAEAVADEAVGELLAYESAPGAAIDPYSADQLVIPLALGPRRSCYTVSDVTEHLRTNIRTVQAFIDRPITIEEARENTPARVIIG